MTREGLWYRLGHARSALRRAAADVRHAAVELRRAAVDLRNAGLEVARAVYAVLLAALPASAEIALRGVGARARAQRRGHLHQSHPAVRPLPKVVVPVPNPVAGAREGQHNGGPVTLLVVTGAGREGLGELVDQVGQLAAAAPVRPVFVTDSDAFDMFRDGGWLFEYLPPLEEWQRLDPEGATYDAFVQRRIAELEEIYRPNRIVLIDGRGGLGRLGGLLATSPAAGGNVSTPPRSSLIERGASP